MPSPGYGLGTIEGRVDGSVSALLDGDGLGQVTRLVDVQTLGPSQGRGEDLQRHHSQQRPQDRGGGGHPDDVVGEGLDVGIPLLRDDDGARATGPDLLDVGDDLVVQYGAAWT